MLKQFSFKITLINVLLAITLGLCTIGTATAAANNDAELLSVDKAFQLNAHILDTQTVELKFDIAKGYLLYRKEFQFRTLEGQPIPVKSEHFPKGQMKKDEVMGNLEVYTTPMSLKIPIATKPGDGILVSYQGCSEEGFCFAPQAKKIQFSNNNTVSVTDLTPEEFSASTENNSSLEATTESESDRIIDHLKTNNLPLILLVFLGIGILLAFTPCVLPMVPILANILVGEKPLSSRRSMLLASLYVLSVALCYSVAGVVAGLMGNQLQTTLQQPIFLASLGIVLILFAISQFDWIHIPLPQVLSQTLHKIQYKQKQGSIMGAMVMGSVSALMVSPCVTPALVGALTYIGQTGDAVLGGTALFAMALGMGLPLLIVACVGSHLLPKAGPWMGHIKTLTGVLLLVLAATILFRAFPNLYASETTLTLREHFTTIHDEKELSTALRSAESMGQSVILDVYADWCISCQQIDREIFANKTVLSTLKNAKLLRLDLTQQTEATEQLKKEFGIIGPPTLLFFAPNGQEIKSYRLVGKIESQDFLKHVHKFLNIEQKQ